MNKELLWRSDNGDGSYNNPILHADYSDPDVIRVGNTFYMTASSFNYTPGLPILTSKDLVNWQLVNYAVDNLPDERFSMPAHSQGIWAPAIRYHNNLFWIFYGMPDEGIYMVQTDNPLGKWREPYLLLPGKGYIDPCPFWDDDGRAYVVHGYAKSRIGFKSILGMFEMSPDGRKVLSDDTFIYDGNRTQPTIEGPKVHKRNGCYYIFAPAGGVSQGWQTVLRSKSIQGPFEERIVLAQRDTIINGPHQGALVDTKDGESWFIHFQDKGIYGRITHLQPVNWLDDGWPVIGVDPDEYGCGKPQIQGPKPKGLEKCAIRYLEASDSFAGTSLGLQWQWTGNHRDDFYSLQKASMALRLNSLNPSDKMAPTLWDSANVLTQKIICPEFEVETKVTIKGLEDNEQTGLVMMGGQYAYVAVRKDKFGLSLVYVVSEGEGPHRQEKIYHRHTIVRSCENILLRMTLATEDDLVSVSMSWSTEGDAFQTTGHKFLPKDDHWVGAKIGIFALAMDQKDHHGYSQFEYFKVAYLEK